MESNNTALLNDIRTYKEAKEKYNVLSSYLRNKIDFISDKDILDNTKENMFRIFSKIVYPVEKIENKDLSQFSKQDTIKLIRSIPTSSVNTLMNIKSIMSTYHNWAINNGLNHTSEDPTQDIDVREIAIVNEARLKNNYISLDDLFEMWETIKASSDEESEKVGYQHFALVLLLRLGLKGTKWSEVLYLEKDDIDFENKIIYVTNRNEHSDDNEKKLELVKHIKIEDDRILEILKAALNEEIWEYQKGKKQMKSKVIEYQHSNYVIKREVKQDSITPSIFRMRLCAFFDGAKHQFIPAKDLFRSAEIDMLLDIKNKSEFNKLYVNDFINVHLFFEPRANKIGYVSLKDLYTRITDDDDIISGKWIIDQNGNRVEYIPDYSKYRNKKINK